MVGLAEQLLRGKSWLGRAQGLNILLDILHSTDTGSVAAQCGGVILTALKLIPGRIWKGQDVVLEILSVVFRKHASLLVGGCAPRARPLEGDDNVVMQRSGMRRLPAVSGKRF